MGPSCVGLPEGPWDTVIDFLVQRFPQQPRALWLQRMADGEVVDEYGVSVTARSSYRAHLRLYYYRSLAQEPRIPFDEVVLFRDAHLLVVDKPHFLPVVPSGGYLQETLLVRLKRALQLPDLVPVHRIDRDTAGLVLLSIDPATRDRYHALFRERQVEKVYEAIAPWKAELHLPLTRSSRIGESAHFMQQRELDGAPNATTHIRLLSRQGLRALYQLRPITGRRHQLRVHMAALGVPIEGDQLYPTLAPAALPDFERPLQLLARSIAFTDPLSGRSHRFESERRLLMAPADAPPETQG